MSSKTKTTATMEDGKPALVPKLRFPEFRDAMGWDVEYLGDICQPQQWTTISSTDLVDRGYPVYGANGFIGYYTDFNHEFETVAVTCRGSTCGEVTLIPPKSYITGNSMCLDGIDAVQNSYHFVYQVLKHRGFDDVISGSAQPQIVGNAIKRLRIALPKKNEQNKIAECLSSVDELIGGEARKLDALKTHKKGLMQQLFPSEGESQPRLRFPEFQNAGEWEDDQLGSVCELYQPVTLSSSELSMTGEYLVYGANGVIGSHNEYNHEESEIAVTCRGATCGEVTITKPKSWVTGNAMIVKPKTKKLRKDFIFHYFKNHGLKAIISGSAQPQITRTGFAPLVVFFPKPDEQKRVADCLTSLDDLIAAQAQVFEVLKTHKKGLMQQLFLSPEEVEI